jgi:hypothetical protein
MPHPQSKIRGQRQWAPDQVRRDEYGRTLERDQEKWKPVFRPIARSAKSRARSGKVETGFPSDRAISQEQSAIRKSGNLFSVTRSLVALAVGPHLNR